MIGKAINTRRHGKSPIDNFLRAEVPARFTGDFAFRRFNFCEGPALTGKKKRRLPGIDSPPLLKKLNSSGLFYRDAVLHIHHTVDRAGNRLSAALFFRGVDEAAQLHGPLERVDAYIKGFDSGVFDESRFYLCGDRSVIDHFTRALAGLSGCTAGLEDCCTTGDSEDGNKQWDGEFHNFCEVAGA
jgi:hypothetical protein